MTFGVIMKKFALISIALISVPAAAQMGGGGPMGGGMRMMPDTRLEVQTQSKTRFDATDANKDGFLDAAEMEAARAKMIAAMKAAGQTPPPGRTPPPGAPPAGGRNRMMERLDTNKDGKLSLAEYSAGPLANFDRWDTNKDGKMSQDEKDAMSVAMTMGG
jgi:EF-hand domain pair